MNNAPSKQRHAGSFGAAAASYEQGRPSYPAEAIDWLVPRSARVVVDLGAGTGKLTRLLVERGLDVVAVEPLEAMRAELSRVLPKTRALPGRAEALPLADASVDAVLVAQAWHWVDPVQAVPEIARVLKPGGTLGLIWNVRDEGEPWVADLGRIIHRHGFTDDGSHNPPVGPPFGPLERHDIAWRSRLTQDELVALVESRSYFILQSASDQAAVIADVRHLIDRHWSGAEQIILPYVTRCWRVVLG